MISGKLHIHTHLFFDSVTSHFKHYRIKYYLQNIILNLPNKGLAQHCQKKPTYFEICYLIHLYASFLFANIFYGVFSDFCSVFYVLEWNIFYPKMFKMTCYTVKKKDEYGCAIYQKSPFIPPKDEKKIMTSKHSEKKFYSKT